MSQWPNPYNEPYQQPDQPKRKTSAMAVTALVLSLTGIIPCCGIVLAPIGALLGLIAVISISANRSTKGRGLAAAAIIIGLLLTVAQIAVGWKYVIEPVINGPRDALTAGLNGNISGFKSEFVGAGASATDAEAQAFIDELRRRYGALRSVEARGDTGQKPSQESSLFEYRIAFADATVRAEVEIVFYHESSGSLMRLGSIRIIDPDQGDLTYPATSNPAATTAPAGNATESYGDE